MIRVPVTGTRPVPECVGKWLDIMTLARKRLGEEHWVQGQMLAGRVAMTVSDIYALPDPANLGRVLAVTESIIAEIEMLAPGAFAALLSHERAARQKQ